MFGGDEEGGTTGGSTPGDDTTVGATTSIESTSTAAPTGTSSTDDSSGTTVGGDTDTRNAAPVPSNDVYGTLMDSRTLVITAEEGLLINDADPDGDALQVVVDAGAVTQSGSTVDIEADGSFSYAVPPTWWGEDAFEYTLRDEQGREATGFVRVVVSPVVVPLDAVASGIGGFAIDGADPGDYAGFAVSDAGDVNLDGLSDVIVGAPFDDALGSIGVGRAYVVFGKADNEPVLLSSIAAGEPGLGFVINGEAQGNETGYSVGGAGDGDGDGRADVVIGAPRVDAGGQASSGRSYVVFGKDDAASVPLVGVVARAGGFALDGEHVVNSSGTSVSGAGDVNGDGLGDVIVGAPGYGNGGEGRSYVVFGTASTVPAPLGTLETTMRGFAISGSSQESGIGISVSSAGDINADGLADVLVGGWNLSGFEDSHAYVVFGKRTHSEVSLTDLAATGDGVPIRGINLSDDCGRSVSSAGDVNGDGEPDVIVGCPALDSSAGRSYVVFGERGVQAIQLWEPGKPNSSGFVIEGVAAEDESGRRVSGVGDLNGDGFADVLIGATLPDGAGQSYVVFGKPGNEAVALTEVAAGIGGFAINFESDWCRLAAPCAASGAGDVNGDGLDDIIIGAHLATPNGVDSGRAYVIFGGDFSLAIDHRGTEEDDTVAGTTDDESLVGGQGDDQLSGEGGQDVLYGGAGDDVIAVPDDAFFVIDGGTGTDTLRLEGEGTNLVLSSIGPMKLRSIERIDITGSGDNDLLIDTRDARLLSEAHELTIDGDAGDEVTFLRDDTSWCDGNPDVGYLVFTNGVDTLRIQDDMAITVQPAAQDESCT